MRRSDEDIMTMVQIILDGVAMNEAALEVNWQEARFRCQMVASGARAAGLTSVVATATALNDLLGPPGSEPMAGYGLIMLRLSTEIDALRIETG